METPVRPTYPLPTLIARFEMVRKLFLELDPGRLLPLQCTLIADRLISRMPKVYTVIDDGKKRVLDPVRREMRRRALMTILRPFREERLESDDYLLAKRIAGNWDTLCQGIEWCAWEDYQKPVWAAVYFRDVQRVVGLKDRLYRCEFEALAGPAAGQGWQQLFSGGFLQMLIRELGVNRYAQWDDTDISGMWFNCLLRSDGRRVRFADVKPSSTQVAHNSWLAKVRRGNCDGPFPRKGRAKCINCQLGRDQCPYARHEDAYTEKVLCANYQVKEGRKARHLGYMPTHSEGICLYCLNEGVIRRDVIEAILDSRRKVKVKEKPVSENTQASAPGRFRPWRIHGQGTGVGAVCPPDEGHRPVPGDVRPPDGDHPAGVVQG